MWHADSTTTTLAVLTSKNAGAQKWDIDNGKAMQRS
jgi:hypothetical protein